MPPDFDPTLYDANGSLNPLMRASEFCAAFYDWRRALTEAVNGDETPKHSKEELGRILGHLNALEIPIRKSNYLWRRIYCRQSHRTEKCPEHKGRWSGYGWPGESDCECSSGADVTGWLPADDEGTVAYGGPIPVVGAPSPRGAA